MPTITVSPFGATSAGQCASLYTLTNSHGMSIKVTDFGATLVCILIPRADGGGHTDVILGFDSAAGYEQTTLYLGATIGRYAGQIKGASLQLNGKTYPLYVNDHENTLHGGRKGFDKRLFTAAADAQTNTVSFTYQSPDGEEGFPGNLSVTSSYQLTDDNRIIMQHTATTDADTFLNMTNHAYYNLNGHTAGSIENHKLSIPADHFLELAADCCPNGRILPTSGTPFDFRTQHTIGERINMPCDQLTRSEGYDHNWNINGYDGTLRPCASLENDDGSIKLCLSSDLPGLQMYSGNYLSGAEPGKDGFAYAHRGALCLEPQFYPAAPAYPNFPSTLLPKNETYHHTLTALFTY